MKRKHTLAFAHILVALSLSNSANAGSVCASLNCAQEEKETPKYRYVYYPVHQVYYAPHKQIWFWQIGNSWHSGVYLPASYEVHTTVGVPVILRSDPPYAEHQHVEKRYGRPWREKYLRDGEESEDRTG